MKIIYLKPKAAYKSPLRSDTLWGALCWSIRMVYGEPALVDLIMAYEGAATSAPFYISSAFPYKQVGKKKIPFFPIPLKKRPSTKEAGESWDGKMQDYRAQKEKKKVQWLSQFAFESLINGFGLPEDQEVPPVAKIETVTHNAIDRIRLGSLMLGTGGQLFQEEERYWTDPTNQRDDKKGGLIHKSNKHVTDQGNVGLYFLAKGDTTLLEGAIRHLGHHGIGGNRSSGKGGFDIEIDDFKLAEPKDFNALTNLSLYHPTKEELAAFYSNKNEQNYRYELEARQGRVGGMHAAFKEKDVIQLFKEGAVFPAIDQANFGQNPVVAEVAHKIRHYGMAFMVKIKCNETNNKNSKPRPRRKWRRTLRLGLCSGWTTLL